MSYLWPKTGGIHFPHPLFRKIIKTLFYEAHFMLQFNDTSPIKIFGTTKKRALHNERAQKRLRYVIVEL